MKPGYLAVFLVAGIMFYLLAISPNSSGGVYRLPIAQARQELSKADLPPVFGGAALDTQVRNTDSQVIWIVRTWDEEVFRYTADLTAEGNGATRVKLKLDGAQGRTQNYAKKLADNPRIRDMYIVAMEERIASTLERRSYDMAHVYPALSAATAANINNLQASVDEVHAAEQKRARNTIEKAYRDEASGVRR